MEKACRRPASLVLDEKRLLPFALEKEDCIDGLEEWNALAGDRGNLAERELDCPDLGCALVKPAEDEMGEGKEKDAMVPKAGSEAEDTLAEVLWPQAGSLLSGIVVEMVKAEDAPASGVEAA